MQGINEIMPVRDHEMLVDVVKLGCVAVFVALVLGA